MDPSADLEVLLLCSGLAHRIAEVVAAEHGRDPKALAPVFEQEIFMCAQDCALLGAVMRP